MEAADQIFIDLQPKETLQTGIVTEKETDTLFLVSKEESTPF